MDEREKYEKALLRQAIRRLNGSLIFGVTAITISVLLLIYPNGMDWLTWSYGDEQPQNIAIAEEILDGIHVESGLIANPGFETVIQNCSGCHSLDIVKQNRASREGWKEIIEWMQATQKLWDLGPNEAIILDYLGANYAPEEKGRRENLKDIEWYDLDV